MLPSVLNGGDDEVALTAAEENADAADTAAAGGEADDADTGTGAGTPTAPAGGASGDRAEAMEEDGADLEAAAEADDAPALAVPPTASADELADPFVYEEPSDEDLLDAVIRYRATVAAAAEDPGRQPLQAACLGVVRHPTDLVVEGSYRSAAALFVADVDGSAVLAVTVLSPTCEILAQVSSN